MSGREKPYAAFILSLIGGLLILLNSALMLGMFMAGFGWMMGFGGMGGGMGMMGPAFGGFFMLMPILALVFGALILVGAAMLYTKPEQAQSWGITILVLSIASLFSGGGFFIGSILGIIGGIIALVK